MDVWRVLWTAAQSVWRAFPWTAAVTFTIAAGVGSNVVLLAFVRGILSVDASSAAPATMNVVRLLSWAGASLFVLTCANVTSLVLFRTSARSPDTALRVAIGARRGQLAGQLLAESLVLAVAGAALAVLLGTWTVQLIPALLWAPDAEQLYFDLPVEALLAAAAVAIVVLSVCGLVPLVDVADRRPAAILQRESAGPSRRAQRVNALLMVVQTAGCSAFVIIAQLLLNSFNAAVQTSLGKLTANPILATVGVQPRGTRAELQAKANEHFDAAERVARQVTGIGKTAWVLRPPGSAPITQRFSVEPQLPFDDVRLSVRPFTVRTLTNQEVVLRAGRLFAMTDTPTSCRVGLLSQDAAGQLFGGQPLGRVVLDASGHPIEIVGVVATDAARPRPDRAIYYYDVQVPAAAEGDATFRVPRVRDVTSAELDTNSVDTNYFTRMGVPLLTGQTFVSTGACRVGVVDRMAAEQYFDGNAVGAALIDAMGRRTTITGVVESSVLRHWQRPPMPMVYWPVEQDAIARMSLALFPDESSPPVERRQLENALAAMPNAFGGVRVTTLQEHLSLSALAPEHISSLLMMCLAAITVVLAAVGLHGAIEEEARQRRREVALRLALGARPQQLTLELSRFALRLAALGSLIGGVLATMVALSLEGSVRGVGLIRYWPWVSGMVAPIAVVAMAGVLPVHRVLRTDLTTLLRRG